VKQREEMKVWKILSFFQNWILGKGNSNWDH
jgi:hypothetical protein